MIEDSCLPSSISRSCCREELVVLSETDTLFQKELPTLLSNSFSVLRKASKCYQSGFPVDCRQLVPFLDFKVLLVGRIVLPQMDTLSYEELSTMLSNVTVFAIEEGNHYWHKASWMSEVLITTDCLLKSFHFTSSM